MISLEDKLKLIDMGSHDAIEYGKWKMKDIINTNLTAVGADEISILFKDGQVIVDFRLEERPFERIYDIIGEVS